MSEPQYVYAVAETVGYHDGVRIVTHKDEAWDASDPIVKKRPDLFRGHVEKVRGTVTKKATPRRNK